MRAVSSPPPQTGGLTTRQLELFEGLAMTDTLEGVEGGDAGQQPEQRKLPKSTKPRAPRNAELSTAVRLLTRLVEQLAKGHPEEDDVRTVCDIVRGTLDVSRETKG